MNDLSCGYSGIVKKRINERRQEFLPCMVESISFSVRNDSSCGGCWCSGLMLWFIVVQINPTTVRVQQLFVIQRISIRPGHLTFVDCFKVFSLSKRRSCRICWLGGMIISLVCFRWRDLLGLSNCIPRQCQVVGCLSRLADSMIVRCSSQSGTRAVPQTHIL